MEFLFQIPETDRGELLRQMMQSFGLTYICLWWYLDQPFNCLQGFDGTYEEKLNGQASSSSGSRARQLFDLYLGLREICVDNLEYVRNEPLVPGHAFKNKYPYLELKMPQLELLVCSQVQWQFYQEARIKTVVFIGCAFGEIELGMSTDPPIDLKTRLESLFPVSMEPPQPIDPHQQRPSSSSSSLRSVSLDDSIEYPPPLFSIPATSFIQEHPTGETLYEGGVRAPTGPPPPPPAVSSPHQQAIQNLSQMRNVSNPSIELENATIMKAILAVLSSPQTAPENVPPIDPARGNRPTAFKRYRGALAPVGAATRRPSSFKKAVAYFRNLLMMRRESQLAHAGNPRPMTAQSLQHTIQERRRRKKINDSFQVLRSLLPPGSKKDKASVLSSTTDYLTALKTKVADLIKRNQMLESQLNSVSKFEKQAVAAEASSPTTERVSVHIDQVSSSRSEARFLDLRVAVRGECIMLDLVIRLLEFLKQHRNLSLMSVESNFRMSEQTIPVHGVMLRLKIEGNEFDEAGFLEAVKRAVDADE